MLRTYAEDYAGWVQDTAAAIEAGRFDEIDRSALANEVRDLGITERTRIDSALCVLLMHLLKTKYQSEKQTRSWEATIRVQRKHLVADSATTVQLLNVTIQVNGMAALKKAGLMPSFSGKVRACAANCRNSGRCLR